MGYEYGIREIVEMTLFFVCIALLIFIIVRGNKRDIDNIDDSIKTTLQNIEPISLDGNIMHLVSWARWLKQLFALVGLFPLKTIVLDYVYGQQRRAMENPTEEEVLALLKSVNKIGMNIIMVGIILVVVWVVYDYISLNNSVNKKLVPAYVHTISRRIRYGEVKNRYAQMYYYDYVSMRCRHCSANIDKLESVLGIIREGQLVYVVVSEHIGRTRFICMSDKYYKM